MQQDQVRDSGEPLERVVVAVGDRLVGDVPARHHERLAGVREQQVVERRVRQHHAELGPQFEARAAHEIIAEMENAVANSASI